MERIIGSRKIDIKPIDDESKMHTTFTKRREGLFNETKKLCDLCGTEAAVIVFSKDGKAFLFGHPHVEEIVDRYLSDAEALELKTEGESSGASVAEALKLTAAEKRLGEAIRSKEWEFGNESLGISEVEEILAAVKEALTTVSTAAAARNIPVNGN